jgi:hypothetical protein
MRPLLTCALAAALTFAASSAALAQAAPPPIGDIPKPPAALYYGVGFVLLAVTILISIMPSKRREQG